MKGKNISAVAGGAAMMILILDSGHAVGWAAEGVDLCFRTVIPALFPFFVISVYLTGNLGSFPLFSPVARWFREGDASAPILICGFLGGYPVGAHCVSDSWKRGVITECQAKRLLTFCSQAGPAFLFGMVSGCFTHPGTPWILWLIQLVSAWLVSCVFLPDCETGDAAAETGPVSVQEALQKALRAMAGVCGWVILFRVILGFCGRWFLWMFPETIQVLLCGMLELTNGCCQLSRIGDEALRFVVCAVLLNLGGICVLMQTMGAAGKLGIGDYLKGKALQTGFALLLSLTVSGFLPPLSLSVLIPVVIFTWKRRKISRFPAAYGV